MRLHINRIGFLALLAFVILWAPACGKKGDPFIPEKTIHFYVDDLQGEWQEGFVLLKGVIRSEKKAGAPASMIRGCRVHYGQYSIENPPCPGCPVMFRGYHEFGEEVVSDGRFSCKVPGKLKGQIYFFKVYLLGPDNAMGPPSHRIKVAVE
jgi:hypothetical protein